MTRDFPDLFLDETPPVLETAEDLWSLGEMLSHRCGSQCEGCGERLREIEDACGRDMTRLAKTFHQAERQDPAFVLRALLENPPFDQIRAYLADRRLDVCSELSAG